MVNAPAHSVGSGSRAKRSLASLMRRTQGFPSGSGWYKKSGCLQYPGVLQETQRTYTHWCQFPSQQSRKWRICLASAVQWVRSISVTFHRNRRFSNRNRLLESMCGLLVILLFPSAQIQEGQCPGKDKSACSDAKVKKDGCIIPGLDWIRNGRCFGSSGTSGGFSERCTVCPASSISL